LLKLRDWLLCNDNLFSSFEVDKVLDLFDLLERTGIENPEWFGEGVSVPRLLRLVTDEEADDLSRKV
jgi:hypothetical protein